MLKTLARDLDTLARDYVVEEGPLVIETEFQTSEDFEAGVQRFTATRTIRLRPKTPAEHAAAGVGPDGQYPGHDGEPMGGTGGTDG